MDIPKIPVGRVVIALQEAFGVSSKEMADLLDIQHARMYWLEQNLAYLDDELELRFRETFGIDLYVAGCCLTLDTDKMPEPMRKPSAVLHAQWDQMLTLAIENFKSARS